MKKVLSILLACFLLLSLVSIVSLADKDAQRTLSLISTITNGSDETDKTEIKDNGSGFVISQKSGWNVWVLNYVTETAAFKAAANDTLYLVYDFTVNGEGQLCLNGWDNSVAAAIAQVAGVSTSTGENGAVILQSGTYTGQIAVTKEMIGESGRLGIAGTGATIRKFQLSTTVKTADFLPGDINNDGEVNTKDLTRLLKVLNHENVEYNAAALDTNGDHEVNSKDLTRLLKYLNHEDVELYGGTTAPSTTPTTASTTTPTSATTTTTTSTSGTTTQTQPVAGTAVDLIDVITNGSNESDTTKIVNNGSGFVINQTNGWNVWVLHYTKNAINFAPAADETLYLVYDFTVNGEGQLCLNVWDNSVAAAIAQVAGVSTSTGENGAVILPSGTYTGQIAISKTMLGETGRLGIAGTGATIRKFQLSTAKGRTTTPSVTSPTTKPTTAPTAASSTSPVATKTAPPTEAGQPYISYNTSQKFGSLGVWWWNAAQITNATQRKQRLDFLQQNRVTEIYLCVGGQSYAQLADFIRDAASRGMRVAWLGGDVSWINPGNTGFDGMFANFKAYQNQAAADAKFYGIHLDVEPHINGDTAANWQNYANLVLRATKAAHDYGTIIEWDIAFWIDARTVTVNGQTKKLLDVLASNSDTLTLMSYRDTTAAVLGTAAEEIPLSAQYGCRIILGLESNYTADGANLSFAEDGRRALCNVADAVLSSLSTKGMTGGYGVAIHHVDTFMNLQP